MKVVEVFNNTNDGFRKAARAVENGTVASGTLDGVEIARVDLISE